MNHLSLFSGIGGIDLAAEWAGFTTVAFCEKDKFCQQVLAKHWPGVPIYDDIKQLTAESLGRPHIDLITGGFPCQPFSHAGKRKGHEDDRYLWPEMLRVIDETRPRWVCGENVAGIISLALDDVLASLESIGYTARAVVIPAAGVGAPHLRDRVFIIAYSEHEGRDGRGGSFGRRLIRDRAKGQLQEDKPEGNERKRRAGKGSQSLADSIGKRLEIRQSVAGNARQEQPTLERSGDGFMGNAPIQGLPDWSGGEMGQPRPVTEFGRPGGREVEYNFRGMAYGVSRRVDRLRALGNAVVPQQVYPILKAIADYEAGGEAA